MTKCRTHTDGKEEVVLKVKKYPYNPKKLSFIHLNTINICKN